MPKPRLKPPKLKPPKLKASLQGRSGATTGKKGVSSGATTDKKSVSSGKTTGKKGVSSGKTSGVTSPKRQSASHERSRSALHNVDVLPVREISGGAAGPGCPPSSRQERPLRNGVCVRS